MAQSLSLQTGYRQILRIALPIGLALLVPQLNFIINNIFLGHLSEEALATASITGVYYLVFAGIGFGLNNGLQSLISRRAGENRREDIGELFTQGILISLCLALAGIAFTWWVAPFIFRAAIHSEQVYQDTVAFLRIRIFGLLFLYIYQMRNALLVGINQSRLLVIGTLSEALANVLFDYTLIYGRWGLPRLGFNGAAIASVIAEFTGMFVIFLVIQRRGIAHEFSLFRSFRLIPGQVRLILKISGPLAFQHGISIMSWFFFYLLVEHQGQTSLAVSNTMRNIFGFFGSFIWAFAATANTMVANLIGQGRQEEVIPIIRRIAGLSSVGALFVCLLLNVFSSAFLSIYGQGNAFMELGLPVLRVVAFTLPLMSLGSVWLNSVTGTGNGRATFLIELVAISAYCLYVYAVLEWQRLGIVWGWMSEVVYWLLLLVFSNWYIRSRRWYNKVI
jgi:MATE family multidrug resistance protein